MFVALSNSKLNIYKVEDIKSPIYDFSLNNEICKEILVLTYPEPIKVLLALENPKYFVLNEYNLLKESALNINLGNISRLHKTGECVIVSRTNSSNEVYLERLKPDNNNLLVRENSVIKGCNFYI